MQGHLKLFTDYNHWANQRMCKMLRSNDAKYLDIEVASSFNSIRKTLYHYWDAQLIWMQRIKGEEMVLWPSDYFEGTDEDAFEELLESDKTYQQLVASDDMNRLVKYQNTRGDKYETGLGDIIMHVMNHSTFHRGQMITMMRGLEVEGIIPTDLILFLREAERS